MHETFLVRTVRRLPALLAIGLGAQVLLASTAPAFHISGATYTGATSAGGTVNFAVSGDGQSISQIGFTDPGPACPFASFTLFGSVPITNHHFSGSSSGSKTAFNGDFASKQSAQGTLSGAAAMCQLTWSATTTASPAGSEECKDAQAELKKAKKAVKKAQGNQQKKKAKKKLKRAKKSVAMFC